MCRHPLAEPQPPLLGDYRSMPTVLGAFVRRPDGCVDVEQVRDITDQVLEIKRAISYCRDYSDRNAAQLVRSGYSAVKSAIDGLGTQTTIQFRNGVSVIDATTASFTFLWRLFFDHTFRDLSQRFGKESEQYQSVIDATSKAFDNHFGYRLIDGLRNYIQHNAMPPLSVSHSQQLDDNDKVPRERITITFHTSPLLEYLMDRNEKRPLQRDLRSLNEEDISFMELLDNAMLGFTTVVAAVTKVDAPELKRSISLLQGLIIETAPNFPELITIPNFNFSEIRVKSQFNIQSETFYDLADLLVDADTSIIAHGFNSTA